MPSGGTTQPVKNDPASLYSPAVGLVYLFNLIVGTGALTMPKAFASAGWLVSLILVVILAGISYVTATFVIETMASANGVRRWKKMQSRQSVQGRHLVNVPGDQVAIGDAAVVTAAIENNEHTPLLDAVSHSGSSEDESHTSSTIFDITETIEMGQMADMFFSRVGITLFYICVIIYLFGDLAIYAAAVPKSLRDVACTYVGDAVNGTSCIQNLTESDLCWSSSKLTRIDVYRLFVTAFAFLLGPFVYFNLQKTKYMQVTTTLLRWVSFLMMIILAVIQLAKGKGQGRPSIGDVKGIPNLFGVCVYAFMCHHSLPQMVTPIRDKSAIYRLFAGDYSLILVFYCLLSFTGIFCFDQLNDLYTLNFRPNRCYSSLDSVTNIAFIQYFLALFPVFTLSASFPIIAITLRNNLKVLLKRETPYPWPVDRLFFPTLTLAIPIAIALGTNNVQILVGVTGSYAGTGIQYVIPACFVLLSRRQVTNTIGDGLVNDYRSPFQRLWWIVIIFIWSVVCIAFVTANHIISGL